MGKNIRSVVIVLIIIFLITFSGYLYMANTALEDKISGIEYQNQQLMDQNRVLQNQNKDLVLKYQELMSQNENLTIKYHDLHTLYTSLLSEYGELNASYHHLQSEYNLTGIVVIEDHAYLKIVKDLLSHANKSIYVAIFVIKYDIKEYDDPVNQLLYALIDAHKRGLDVKVLVDDPTLRSYPDTISYLKNNSIEVKLDEKKGVTSHMKIVIIDDKYLVVGSHNWTESALSYNHEYSVLIISKYYAEKARRYFLDLWANGRNI